MFTTWLRGKLTPKSRSWPPERPLLVYGRAGRTVTHRAFPHPGPEKGG